MLSIIAEFVVIRHARRPSLCCKSLCTNIIWPLFVSLELFESSKPLRRTFALFCPCLFSRSRFLLLVCMHALILLARPMCMWCKQLLFGAYPTKARGKKDTRSRRHLSAFGPLQYQENIFLELVVSSLLGLDGLYIHLAGDFDYWGCFLSKFSNPNSDIRQHTYQCPVLPCLYNCTAFDSLRRKDYKRVTETFSHKDYQQPFSF